MPLVQGTGARSGQDQAKAGVLNLKEISPYKKFRHGRGISFWCEIEGWLWTWQFSTKLLLLLLKSVEVDDDVALLLSCAVLGSMCTQVTLQSKLRGTGSAAVRTLWTCLWFCCGRMTRGSTFLGGTLTKCARPTSQVAFHTTRSLARVSRPHGLMWHLCRFILMRSMNRFFGAADWSLPRWKLTTELPTGEPVLRHSVYMREPAQLSL